MKKNIQKLPALAWAAAFVLLLDLVVALTLGSLSGDNKVYLRDVLFSEILSDAEVPNDAVLNQRIEQGFKREKDPSRYLAYLNPDKARSLMALRDSGGVGDRALAIAIAQNLGTSDGKICGLDSLGHTVFDVERGMGCCSDFSKSWIFYARYLGMVVREVSTFNHTTVEYLDRSTGKWDWLDSFNRAQILNGNRRPMDQYAIRESNLFEALAFKRLIADSDGFDADAYEGYAPSQYAVLLWRKGTNFLEVDHWDSRLRSLKVPKSLRQVLLLVGGVQPSWLMLATNSMAVYLKALQMFLFSTLGLVMALNAGVLVWGAAKLLKQRVRRLDPAPQVVPG